MSNDTRDTDLESTARIVLAIQKVDPELHEAFIRILQEQKDLRAEVKAWEETAKEYDAIEDERDRLREALKAIVLRLHGPSQFLGSDVSAIAHAALNSLDEALR